MLVVTTPEIPGHAPQEIYGLVCGSSVRSKHIGRNIAAGLKSLIGGELRGYTEMLEDARNEALSRMVQAAQKCGANAVVNVRITTSAIAQGASEIVAYGTAIRI